MTAEQNTAYQQILDRKKKGDLRVISVSSPARCSCSSLLRAISESRSVDAYSYEPFRRPIRDASLINDFVNNIGDLTNEQLRSLAKSLENTISFNTNIIHHMHMFELDKAFSEIFRRYPEITGRELQDLKEEDGYANRIVRGYERICELVQYIESQTDSSNTIMIKELSKNLYPDGNIKHWNRLIDNNVIIIRNPLLQMESLIKALGKGFGKKKEVAGINLNKYALEKKKEFNLNFFGNDNAWGNFLRCLVLNKDYRPMNDIIEAFLESTAEDRDYGDIRDYEPSIGSASDQFKFRREGWHWAHRNYMDSNCNTIVDSSTYRSDPQQVIAMLCNELDIEFNESMIYRWVNGFSLTHSDGITHYNIRSGTSEGIHIPDERCIKLNRLPSVYNDYMREVALPAYLHLSQFRLSTHTEQELEAISKLNVGMGVRLKDVDPVFCYSAICTAQKIALSTKMEMKYAMRNLHPDFREEFNLIDEIMESKSIIK